MFGKPCPPLSSSYTTHEVSADLCRDRSSSQWQSRLYFLRWISVTRPWQACVPSAATSIGNERRVSSSRRRGSIDHISPLLSRLHWLKASERITWSQFWRTNVNMVWRQRVTDLRRPANAEVRRRLRSASSASLDVRRTRLSTVGARAFPVAAARLWNSLPSHVTAASLSPSLNQISSHYLIPLSDSFSHLYSAAQ